MARLTQGTGTVVLSGLRDSTSSDTAVTRGYVDTIAPHSSARDFITVANEFDRLGLRGVQVGTLVYVSGTRSWSLVTSVDSNGAITVADPIELTEYVELPTQASGDTATVATGDLVRVGTDVYVATSAISGITQADTLPAAWIELTADTNTTYQFNDTVNSGSTLGVAFTNNANVITGTVDASLLAPHVAGTWHSVADQAARDALTGVAVGDYVLQEDISQVERVTAVQGTDNQIGTAEVTRFGIVQLTATPVDVPTFTIAVDRTNDRVYLNTDAAVTGATITSAPTTLTELTGASGGTYTGSPTITVSAGNVISVTDNSIGAAQLNVTTNGTQGQVLTSLGNGAFSWTDDDDTTYAAGTGITITGANNAIGIADDGVTSTQILNNNVTADELDVTGDGTSGQFLTSDGDGSFSWTTPTPGGGMNTNTTYDLAASANGNNVDIDLTAGGSGSGTDTITVTGGTNVTIDSVSATGFTINSSFTDTTYTGGTGITVATNDEISITDGGVDTTQLADDAVTQAKLADNSVGSDQIIANAVGSSEIADSAVGPNQLATSAVETAKIDDGAVTTGKIANNAINSDKIADNAVTSSEILANAVTATELNVNGNGTLGQSLTSAGDGSFNWTTTPLSGATDTIVASTTPQALKQGDIVIDGLNAFIRSASGQVMITSSTNFNTSDYIEIDDTRVTYTDFTRTASGLVPNPGGTGTTRFLREDGGWHTPPGGGGTAVTIDSLTDISREWPSSFSGFSGGAPSLTAGDLWRESGVSGQVYVYAGADVTVTSANFSELEPVDDNPIWRQIAGHSLFNWPNSAPVDPFTILHGTLWNGTAADPGVFIWTGADETVTNSTYASFTPSTSSTVHDWRHLDASGGGIDSGTTLPTTSLTLGRVFSLTATDSGRIAGLYRYNGTNWERLAAGSEVPSTATIRGLVSANTSTTPSGNGSLGYSASTGRFTYTPAAAPTVRAWPGSSQTPFTVPIGSYWSQTVASQLRIFQYTGHTAASVTSSNYTQYVPQFSETYWKELGSEGAAKIWLTTFRQLFFRAAGDIWTNTDGDEFYLSTISAAIHDQTTLDNNAPAQGASGWVRLDASSSGGLNAVASDVTLRGLGTSASPLGLKQLPLWASNEAYQSNDMVVDSVDYALYKANTTIAASTVATVPRISNVAYDTQSRYVIAFGVGGPPAVDQAETYRFDITGAVIQISFTISGADIDQTTFTNHWVINPAAAGTSFAIVSGANPVAATPPVTSITGSLGTIQTNPRPAQDPTRWTLVSGVDLDYNERYSQAVGETLQWTEGTTGYVGAVTAVRFDTILATDTTISGTGAAARLTVVNMDSDNVALFAAADRVILTSAASPVRTIGVATVGSNPTTVVFESRGIQGDSFNITDPVVAGNALVARGALDFRASFAAVSAREAHDVPVPNNLIEDFHSVPDEAARLALTTSDAKFGDVVYQQDDDSEWQITHGTAAVANFLNFTWAAATSGSGGRELALHFSDSMTMPVGANVYTLVSGADTWSFLGSRVRTRTALNNTIEWRIPDASIGGSTNRDGLQRAGTLTSSDGTFAFRQINFEADREVHLTEDNQTLTVTVDGVSASVQTRDVKFGGTLPAVANSVRGEVYAIYGNGYRDANLHIFDGTAWRDANLNVGDFEVRGEANFVNAPTSTAHSDNEIRTGTDNNNFSVNNEVAVVGDVRAGVDLLRQELGHQVSQHSDLLEEPGTSTRHVQGIELGGDFADGPNGTFRHARLVTQSVEYPTTAETADLNTTTNNAINSTFGASFIPLQAGLWPQAPLRGQQGSVHDTSRLQQYHHSTQAAVELGLGGDSGRFINNDFFFPTGNLADNTADPSGSPINARYHLRGQGLINSDASSGSLTTINGGFAIGMVFSPTGDPFTDALADECLWSMDFGAGSLSDVRNVGVYLEETSGSNIVTLTAPTSAQWVLDSNNTPGAFFDIEFPSEVAVSSSQSINYTLTLASGETYTFPAHDGNGNGVTTRTRFGNFFWRVPRALITSSINGTNLPFGGYFTNLTLTRNDFDHYRIRIKSGTSQTALLSDTDGVVELDPADSYNILSYIHLDANNRINIVVRLFDWNSMNEEWDLRTGLGHTGTLTGYRVVDATTTTADRIHVTSPSFNIGISEYQGSFSVSNNRITMSKTFIARANTIQTNDVLDALATSGSPFRGLIVSAASSGYEIRDLPYVDIPYTGYDNASGTISPAADWLIPNLPANPTEAQMTLFRNNLNTDGSWTPVSESSAALGTYNGTTTNSNARIETELPNQGDENISTTDVRQFWIHPTGSGYVDPVRASTEFTQINPRDGASTQLTFNIPQGPIQGLTYFTTSGTDGAASPIRFLDGTNTGALSLDWDTSYFLGDSTGGTMRVYSMAPSSVSSVSHNLVTPGDTRRIYVPEYRDDYRTDSATLSPLTAADLDPNTHYLRGLFLDGRGRQNYFAISDVDTSVGLLYVTRVDNPIADSHDTIPTGRNIELQFGRGTNNLDIQQFASFQFQVETPRDQYSAVSLDFDPIGIFLGSPGTPVGLPVDNQYYIPYTRRGVTYYWYPNKTLNNQQGVFQSDVFTGTIAGTGQWIMTLIG